MDYSKQRTWGPTPNYPLVESYKRNSNKLIQIAGPCSVENVSQIKFIAKNISDLGVTHLRGGTFRAGTYPGDNFGIVSEELLKAHKDVANDNGMKNIMEVLDYSPTALELYDKYADCLQIGSRSMQNYTLLKKVAEMHKPVFLKRNQGSTIDEFLGAAEYLLKYSSNICDLYLIERGSSGFATHVRWDLSISMIPAIKKITEIPIIVDGSHGTGRSDLVEPMTLAGIAAGADGYLCEVHSQPESSLSDKEQAIDFNKYKNIVNKVNLIKDIR